MCRSGCRRSGFRGVRMQDFIFATHLALAALQALGAPICAKTAWAGNEPASAVNSIASSPVLRIDVMVNPPFTGGFPPDLRRSSLQTTGARRSTKSRSHQLDEAFASIRLRGRFALWACTAPAPRPRLASADCSTKSRSATRRTSAAGEGQAPHAGRTPREVIGHRDRHGRPARGDLLANPEARAAHALSR